MIRNYHNNKLLTNPWHRAEENNNHHHHQEDKLSKTTSSLFPIPDDCKK